MGLDYSLFLIILFSILDIETNSRIFKMFNFFKKNTSKQDLEQDSSFDIELSCLCIGLRSRNCRWSY